jgi:hypothetical protein
MRESLLWSPSLEVRSRPVQSYPERVLRWTPLALALVLATRSSAADDTRAAAIHRDALVVDGHNDVTSWIRDLGFDLAMDGAAAG